MDNYYYSRAKQSTYHDTYLAQIQDQSLCIHNSHNIIINQIEIEGLFVLQASLLAAIEGLLVAFDGREDFDAKQLQYVKQELTNLQLQRQYILIEDSNNISLSQVEVQIELAVQAAMELLAKLTAKLIDV